MTEDERHLHLLSVFHYVVAAMLGLVSLLPLIYLAIGIAMVTGHLDGKGDDPAGRVVGWFLACGAGFATLAGLSVSTCVALGGRFLARHRRYTFCLVASGLACFFAPLGTVLGVLTIVLLMRDPVRALFGRPPFAAASAPPAGAPPA
jgi:hypothetical protein